VRASGVFAPNGSHDCSGESGFRIVDNRLVQYERPIHVEWLVEDVIVVVETPDPKPPVDQRIPVLESLNETVTL